MHNLTLTILLLVCSVSSAAELVAYKFSDGNYYLDTKQGPQKLKIVDLTNGEVPDKPTTDKFGLTKISSDAAKEVVSYTERNEDATKLAAYYTGFADAVASGSIPQNKFKEAGDEVFRLAVGNSDIAKWQSWKDKTSQAFSNHPDINDAASASQGLLEIAEGVKSVTGDTNNAIDWEKLIKFFIEVILPLIIQLIGSGG